MKLRISGGSIGWVTGSLSGLMVLLLTYVITNDDRLDGQVDTTGDSRSRRAPPASATGHASARDMKPDFLAQVMRVLKTQPERQTRLMAAFGDWQKNQPELAVKLMRLVCERLCGTPSVSTPAPHWSEAELQQGIELILNLEKSEEILPFFSELAGRLAAINPTEAIASLNQFPGTTTEKDQILGEVVDKWVLADPDGAAKWACSEPSGPGREWALQRIVQSLVQVDPVYRR